MKSLTTLLGVIVLGGVLALTVLPVRAAAEEDAAPVSPPTKMCCAAQSHGPGAVDRGCPMTPHCARMLRCVVSILALVHVLLAGWVYTDIRKRGEGHGIFIVLALLGGIPAAMLYALVRIGDKKS